MYGIKNTIRPQVWINEDPLYMEITIAHTHTYITMYLLAKYRVRMYVLFNCSNELYIKYYIHKTSEL